MLIGQENLRSSPSPPVSCAETLAQNNESQENHGGLKKKHSSAEYIDLSQKGDSGPGSTKRLFIKHVKFRGIENIFILTSSEKDKQIRPRQIISE